MPVSAWIAGGIGRPGSTSVDHASTTRLRRRRRRRHADDRDLGDAFAWRRPCRSSRGRRRRGRGRTGAWEEGVGFRRGSGQGPGLDRRTIVRYCSRMSNDRSYLASLQDYYSAPPRAALVRVDRPAAGPQVQVVGGGDGRAPEARRLHRLDARQAAGTDQALLRAYPRRVAGARGHAQPDRRRRGRRADHRRLPHRAAVADRAGARQGRLDDGRRHPRGRSRRRREGRCSEARRHRRSRSSTGSSRSSAWTSTAAASCSSPRTRPIR